VEDVEEHLCKTSSFTCIIKNFRNCKEKFGERITSSQFSLTDSDNQVTEWCLLVYPRGLKGKDNVEYKDFVGVGLQSLNEYPVTVLWEGWILNEAQNKENRRTSAAAFSKRDRIKTLMTFIKQSDLTDRLLPKGNLTLVLEITVHDKGKNPTSATPSNNLHQRNKRRKKLCDDLGQVLANKEFSFSDIQLNCQEKVFPCHQFILAARSPVFKAMLQADMKEKQTKEIFIEDFNSKTVAEMLYFMYTGDISLDDMGDVASDLLRVAAKYQLDDLKEMCEEKLVSNLSVENSIESLVLGDSHNASKLKRMALDLIAKNMKKIVKTDVYNDLAIKRPALTLEITKVVFQDND